MKKHLVATAVAAAFAVPVSAQVTISGNIEAGYTSKDVRALSSTTSTVKQSNIGSGHFGTPQINFGATEDLGGGLKASFLLSREFNTGSGSDDVTGQYNQTWVSLAGGFGTVQVGKFAHATRDAGGVYRFMGDIGRLAGSMNSLDERVNGIQYVSPAFNGFTVSLASSDADHSVTSATQATDNAKPASLSSMGLRGSVAGVNFSIGRETLKFLATQAGANQAELDLDTIGAGFKIGPANVGVVVAKQELQLATGASGGQRDARGVHVAYPMGAFTIGASMTNYQVSPAAGGAKPKADITTFGARYALSKRTSIVGSYQQLKNSGAADALAVSSGASAINTGTIGGTRGLGVVETTGQTTSGIGLTVVHNF